MNVETSIIEVSEEVAEQIETRIKQECLSSYYDGKYHDYQMTSRFERKRSERGDIIIRTIIQHHRRMSVNGVLVTIEILTIEKVTSVRGDEMCKYSHTVFMRE